MGTYLSTPVTDKHDAYGESLEFITTTDNDDDETDGIAIPYVHWGVVEMQGWRKSMEDAHVTQTNVALLNVPSPPLHRNNSSSSSSNVVNTAATDTTTTTTTTLPSVDQTRQDSGERQIPVTHVFGVFDGHGGGEVARFVALYIVSVLQQQLAALFVPVSASAAAAAKIPSTTTTTTTVTTTTTELLYQQHIGTPLIQTFHALDRMIDDPMRRDEILKLRTLLPTAGSAAPEQRTAVNIPPPPLLLVSSSSNKASHPVVTSSSSSSSSLIPSTMSSSHATVTNPMTPQSPTATPLSTLNTDTTTTTEENHVDDPIESSSSTTTNSTESTMDASVSTINDSTGDQNSTTENDDDDDADSLDHPMNGTEEACALDQDMMLEDDDHQDTMDADSFDEILVTAMRTTTTTASVQVTHDDTDIVILHNNSVSEITITTNKDGTTATTTSSSDMDTTHAVEVLVAVDSDDERNNSISSSPLPSSVSGKVSGMLQRLLKLSGPAGQVILGTSNNTTAALTNTTTTIHNQNASATSNNNSNSAVTQPPSLAMTVVNSPNNNNNNNNNTTGVISPPSVVRNGQLMCNLKDHPIHAGATAIVAVIHGRTLTVANAGDSRAVLCRGTLEDRTRVVVPLSTDHKPMQATELFRIIHAGGFVNTFGRVNGNLNLSRSIGDLKYKQVHHLSPAQQMITAEPDIVQMELNDTDEFIIIGCDGIWDCLTNEKAVEFVATRIHDYTPTEIGTMMLNFIISPDPRQTQGIGGDNMTILIIDLQPKTRRWYRSRSIQSSTTMSESVENSRRMNNTSSNDSSSGRPLVQSPTK